MNTKRFLIATLVLFVFMFLYQYLLNTALLLGSHESPSDLMRDFSGMKTRMPMVVFIQLLFAAWMAFAFAQTFKDGGIQNGLLFGIFLGGLVGLINASWFLWLPVPASFSERLLATGFGECLGGGLILGLIYRK